MIFTLGFLIAGLLALVGAFVLAVVMCLLCVAIFWYALLVQFPLFQWGGR